MRVIICAKENEPKGRSILDQMELCQNFADFFDYEVVGIAIDNHTLLDTDIDYDGVIVADRDIISPDKIDYKIMKTLLLEKDIIIIPAVRSY